MMQRKPAIRGRKPTVFASLGKRLSHIDIAFQTITGPDANLAPEVGFEPTTNRLTADRSTTELLWNCVRSNERLYSLRTRSRTASDLVAGAGFEPAAFRL